MQKLFLLAALLATGCLAAPQQDRDDNVKFPGIPLQRPSPINPDILSDPKPPEKVTMITDPKEIAKHKREIKDEEKPVTHLLPTIPPSHEQSSESAEVTSHEYVAPELHHRQKRHQKSVPAVETSSTQKPLVKPAPAADKTEVKPKPEPPKRRSKPRTSTTAAPPQKKVAPVPETTKQRQRRDISVSSDSTAAVSSVPLVYRDENRKPHESASYVAYVNHELSQAPDAAHQSGYAATQTLTAVSAVGEATPHSDKPATLASNQYATSAYAKRDIPVPLEPTDVEEKKAENHDAEKKTSENLNHALHNAAVAASSAAVSHPKRDIPVPLVPKYQHPEESPKSDEDKTNEHTKTEEQHKVEEHKEEAKPHGVTTLHQALGHAAAAAATAASANSASMPHPKRDVTVPQQNPADTSTEGPKKIETEAKIGVASNLQENAPHVQVSQESAQAHAHLQQPHHQIQHEFHIQNSHALHRPLPALSYTEASTTSTTAHPIIRPHPVPVAELFSRPQTSHEN